MYRGGRFLLSSDQKRIRFIFVYKPLFIYDCKCTENNRTFIRYNILWIKTIFYIQKLEKKINNKT